jgi:hypothetical protein
MVDVRILGLVDPDGDPVSYRILRVTQDEPVVCKPGRAWPPFDAAGIGTDSLQLRAERRGDPSGNGRVYEITFVALDSRGGECEGRVTVCVPHDNRRRRHCTDDGQQWDSAPSLTDLSPLDVRQYPNPFNPSTTIEYTLTVGGPVNVTVYDAAGRRLRLLDSGTRAAGVHAVVWDGRDARGGNMPSGLYFLRIDAGEHAETRRMLLVK